jgi:isopenicillin N synthase-like dioxygenase
MNTFGVAALECLSRNGYLFVSPEPELRAAIEKLLSLASLFFDEPVDEKLKCSTDDRREGYRPFGAEYSLSPDVPDLTESFSCAIANSCALGGFPDSTGRALYEQMLVISASFASLTESLTNAVYVALTGRSRRVFGVADWSRLQVNCSRPDSETREIIHHRHEDSDLLTIALATEAGLEIERASSEWCDVPHGLDHLLVLPSEVLWLLTGGLIAPLYHRVRRTSGIAKRLALLYFADADPSASEPWITSDVNRNVDIGSRVFSNSERYGVPPVRNREESD